MLSPEEALKTMKSYVSNENLQKHCLSTEVVMKTLAKKLKQDVEKWSLAGLLHDVDYMETSSDPSKHSLVAVDILKKIDVPEDVIYAVKVHNEMHGFPRNSLLDKALYAVDPLTGFIVACVLITPEKKLNLIDVPFLQKRFKEKAFAKGANREQIASCEELDLSLEEFMGIGLKAMQSISEELGL